MKKEQKNTTIIVIAVVAIIAIIAAVFLIVNNNKGSSDGGQPVQDSSNVAKRVSADDLKGEIYKTVEYNDYESMEKLSKEIQNGYITGKVVTIDGKVSHKLKSYSLVQRNSSDNKSIGTVFLIDDAEESDYPKDEDRIKITAKVVEVDTMNFQLVTLKEFVQKM